MSWILIAIIAYLFLAIVGLADKFLLDKILPSTKAYTFLVGILSLLAFLIAPWFLKWPGFYLFFFNVIIGALFPVALLLLYKSLKDGEASKVITLIGGAMPVFTLILSILFLGESFSNKQWMAIVFLLIGTIIISWIPKSHNLLDRIVGWLRFGKKQKNYGIFIALGSALIFALFFTGTKYLYIEQPFLSAFIWIRLGTFIAALFLLINKDSRREIFNNLKRLSKGSKKFLFLSNQGLAAIGSFLQNYAIALGSVALVNALQGVQYAFLLILGGLITVFYPKIIKENISRFVIVQKIIAIMLIGIGLYFISS